METVTLKVIVRVVSIHSNHSYIWTEPGFFSECVEKKNVIDYVRFDRKWVAIKTVYFNSTVGMGKIWLNFESAQIKWTHNFVKFRIP